VLEGLAYLGIVVLVGAAIARRWIVVVPFGCAALWVAWLAIRARERGTDLDRLEAWTYAVLFYGLLALVVAVGLAVGVALAGRARHWHRKNRVTTTPL
jgi:hypothetical protein